MFDECPPSDLVHLSPRRFWLPHRTTYLRRSPSGCTLGHWGFVVRILRLVPAVAALLTCACADPYVIAPITAGTPGNWVSAGEWRIERQTDRVTGKPISSAVLVTHKSSNSQSPLT